jgi:hypothetical protein
MSSAITTGTTVKGNIQGGLEADAVAASRDYMTSRQTAAKIDAKVQDFALNLV